MNRLAVGMMVKNEEHIIERCLTSLLPLNPDKVIITDTGSTDNTITKIALFLHKYTIPFKISKEKFVDFAHNRTLILDLIKKESDINYVLMVDADEVVRYSAQFHAPSFKNNLNCDAYNIILKDSDMSYYLPRLTSTKADLKYKGVTHEFLDIKDSHSIVPNTFLHIEPLNDSSRRKSNEKYQNDIDLLKNALETETDEMLYRRYVFYLAQSYMAIQDKENTIKYYKQRTQLGGWEEEIYYSFYQMGNMFKNSDFFDAENIITNYLLAFQAYPKRIESLYALREYFEAHGKNHLAALLTPTIEKTLKPKFGLFLEDHCYVKKF